jgi:hypothetical protein
MHFWGRLLMELCEPTAFLSLEFDTAVAILFFPVCKVYMAMIDDIILLCASLLFLLLLTPLFPTLSRPFVLAFFSLF